MKAVLVATVALVLLPSLWAGLRRMGVALPEIPGVPGLEAMHGPLMATFLSVLVGVERAAAVGWRWAWAAPVLSLGGALVLLGASRPAAALLLAGSLVHLAVNVVVTARRPQAFLVVMALGALALPVGHAAWLAGRPVPEAVPWWAGFIVLTIVGERIERSRLTAVGPRELAVIFAACGALLGALAWATWVDREAGLHAAGIALVAAGAWLLLFDVARRALKTPGLPRFMAAAVLLGAAWLVVAGALWIAVPEAWSGPLHDAVVHAIFLGFVFSMIFGHAPVIVPALLGARVGWSRVLWLPLVVLQVSMVARISGDLLGAAALREAGAIVAVGALAMFPPALAVARRRAAA